MLIISLSEKQNTQNMFKTNPRIFKLSYMKLSQFQDINRYQNKAHLKLAELISLISIEISYVLFDFSPQFSYYFKETNLKWL